MRTSRPLLVAATASLALAALAAPGAARGDGAAKVKDDNLVMHRVQAGTPGKDGWYEARSTEGRFRVRLPIPFNDFTVRPATKDDVALDVIGSRSSEGFKFSAVRMHKTVPDAAAELERFSRELRAGAKAAVARRLEHRGRPAIELDVPGQPTSAAMREIVVPDGVILLTVEYPTERRAEVAPLIPMFFASLEVDAK